MKQMPCEQRQLFERKGKRKVGSEWIDQKASVFLGTFLFSVLCGEFSQPSVNVPYAMLHRNAEVVILKCAIRFRNQSMFSAIT